MRVHLDIAEAAEVLAAPPDPDPDAARDTARLLGQIDPRAAEIVRSVHLDE